MASREGTKGPEAFRTISEASNELGVPQHVLRFWETKFSFIRPMKRAGGRRFYRRQDLEVLKGVRVLLHEGGYTIKGVQRLHKEAGVRRLIGAGEGDIPPPVSESAPPAPEPVAPQEAREDIAPELIVAAVRASEAASPARFEEAAETPADLKEPQPAPALRPTSAALADADAAGAAPNEREPAVGPDAGILRPAARSRLESVLRDLERVKAGVDRLLAESDA